MSCNPVLLMPLATIFEGHQSTKQIQAELTKLNVYSLCLYHNLTPAAQMLLKIQVCEAFVAVPMDNVANSKDISLFGTK